MRILTQINKELKYFKSSLHFFLLCFLIAPIVLGFLYGALYEKLLTPDIEINPIKIYLADTAEDIYLPALKELLKAKELDFIYVENVLPSELEKMTEKNRKSLGIKEEDQTIQIVNHGASSTEKEIVKNLIKPLVTTLSHLDVKTLNKEERTEIIEEYLFLSDKDFTTVEEVAVQKRLTSYQLMIINVFIGLSFFITVTFASSFLKERESSVICRLFSIDVPKRSIYSNTVLAVFIISLLLVTTHSFLAYGIILKTQFSFIQMFILNIFHAGFLAALYGVFIGLFRTEHFFKNLITPILSMILFFGGSFFPIDTIQNLAKFVHLLPNYNLLKLYEGLLLGTSLEKLIYPILFILAAIAILFLVGIFKFSLQEEKAC